MKDDDGYKTGYEEVVYTTPTELWLNVMPKSGEAENDIFGKATDYSKVAISDDPNCPITEYSRIWTDGITPGTTQVPVPYNYVVKKIYRTLNTALIALQEVKVK